MYIKEKQHGAREQRFHGDKRREDAREGA